MNDTGDHVWVPIWEAETTIVRVSGMKVEFDVASGEFSRIGRLVPGTFIDGSLAPGSRVFVAESSSATDDAGVPIVVIVGLE